MKISINIKKPTPTSVPSTNTSLTNTGLIQTHSVEKSLLPITTAVRVFKEPPKKVCLALSDILQTNTNKEKVFKNATKIQNVMKSSRKRPNTNRKRKKEECDINTANTNATISISTNDLFEIEERKRQRLMLRPPPDQIIAKQKPTSLSQVIGQEAAIKSMSLWLQSFQNKQPSDLPRCLILTGPSGVGKTLCADLLLRENGYKPIVFSSDMSFTNDGSTYGAFSEKAFVEQLYKILNKSNTFEKSAVILESLCGLSSKVLQVLVDVVSGERKSRLSKMDVENVWMLPVVITTDASEMPSLVKLTRVCHVVEFERVGVEYLKPFFENICEKEDIRLPQKVKDDVVCGCGGDVRRLLNTLHFFALNSFDFASNEVEEEEVGSVIDISTIFYDETNSFNIIKHFLKSLRKKMKHNIFGEPEKEQTEKEAVENMQFTHKSSLAFLLAANHMTLSSSIIDGPVCKNTNEWIENVASTAELISDNDILYHNVYDCHNGELFETCTNLMNWGVATNILKTSLPSSEEREFANDDLKKLFDEFKFERSMVYSVDMTRVKRRETMSSFVQFQERETDMLELFEAITSLIKHYAQNQNKKSANLLPLSAEEQTLLDWIKEKQISYKDLQTIWKVGTFSSSLQNGTNMPNPKGPRSLRKFANEFVKENKLKRKVGMEEVKKKKK